MSLETLFLTIKGLLTTRLHISLLLAPILYVFFIYTIQHHFFTKHSRHLQSLLTVCFLTISVIISSISEVFIVGVTNYALTILLALAIYFLAVFICWFSLSVWSSDLDRRSLLPIYLPIIFLFFLKLLSLIPSSSAQQSLFISKLPLFLIGTSYVSFRLSLLAMDVRNQLVERPSFPEYLFFAFFIPTLSVGPISPYREFAKAREHPITCNSMDAIERVVIGIVKYIFIATIVNQFSYSGLMLDGHPHTIIDLIISMFAYYIFLFLNFSGYCDLAIGLSAFLGIPVRENFNYPFLARNIKDFWNRWHITLSEFMRDMFFNPVVKIFSRRFGQRNIQHIIPIVSLLVFLLIGLWHGFAANYLIFGLLHGIGVGTNHYYTLLLKKRLSPENFKKYCSNLTIKICCQLLTFLYVSFSLFFFANSVENIYHIFQMIE